MERAEKLLNWHNDQKARRKGEILHEAVWIKSHLLFLYVCVHTSSLWMPIEQASKNNKKKCSHHKRQMHPGCLIVTNSHLTISTCARGNSSRRADRPCWTKCSRAALPLCFFLPIGLDMVHNTQKAILSQKACHWWKRETKNEKNSNPISVFMHRQCAQTIPCNTPQMTSVPHTLPKRCKHGSPCIMPPSRTHCHKA